MAVDCDDLLPFLVGSQRRKRVLRVGATLCGKGWIVNHPVDGGGNGARAVRIESQPNAVLGDDLRWLG